MDASHEQAIRQAASLAYHLAAVERAVEVAEELDALNLLPKMIRMHITLAEQVAADDLARCREIIRGQYHMKGADDAKAPLSDRR